MSQEFQVKTSKIETFEAANKIETALEGKFKTQMLDKPGVIAEFGKYQNDYEPMCQMSNTSEGVFQSLECVVRAGNEFFCVVNSSHFSESEKINNVTILTRHIAGGRAEYVATIESDSVLAVGRSDQNDFDKTVSMKHFSITKRGDGLFGIADDGSTNHTEVFMPGKRYQDQVNNPFDKTPVEDLNFWSVKSSVLKDIINGQQ